MERAGDLLYHYTTREVAFEHILPERRLRLSPYARMSDPLESKDWQFTSLGFYRDLPEDPQERLAVLKETYARSNSVANELKRRAKLLALTQDAPAGLDRTEVGSQEPFQRGWARARMWERYGEGHRGVCLAFHANSLCARIERQLRECEGADEVQSGQVSYTVAGLAGVPAATSFTLSGDPTRPPDIKQGVRQHFNRHAESLFFLKTLEWETEYEFRFVGLADRPGFAYVDFGDTLAQVIAGEQLPAYNVPGIQRMCEAIGVEAKQVRWESFRPHLVELSEFPQASELTDEMEFHRAAAREVGPDGLDPFRPLRR